MTDYQTLNRAEDLQCMMERRQWQKYARNCSSAEFDLDKCILDSFDSDIVNHPAAQIMSSGALFLAVFGTILNPMIMYMLLHNKEIRKHINTPFIISIIMNDIVMSSISLPIRSYKKLYKWKFICTAEPVISYSINGGCLLIIAIFSFQRWFNLHFPKKWNHLFTRTKTKIYLVCVMFIPFTSLLLPAFGVQGQIGLLCSGGCTIVSAESGVSVKTGYMGVFMAVLVLIFLTAISVHFKIKRVRQELEKIRRQSMDVSYIRQAERKVMHMTAFIFIACIIPFLPPVLIKLFDPNLSHPYLQAFSHILSWSRVILNPISYFILWPKYRRAIHTVLIKIYGKARRREDPRRHINLVPKNLPKLVPT